MTLFRLSPQFLFGWRRFLLRLFGAKVGDNVLVRPTARVTYPWKVTIGDHSWVGDDVVLYSLAPIEIGSHCVISQRSYLCAATHDYRSLEFPIVAERITIEDGVWLATDVFVNMGIRIGRGTVVGARSTVLRDLPAMKICFGNPAAPVSDREA